MGRSFPNLYAIEKTMKTLPGVTDASAYIFYGENNGFYRAADLQLTPEAAGKRAEALAQVGTAGDEQELQAARAAADPFSLEKVAAYAESKLGAGNIPQVVNII